MPLVYKIYIIQKVEIMNNDKKDKQYLNAHLITWVGGKRLLRKRICELIPKNIKSYIEPFGGGGWVLFAKEKHATLEVYNDLDNRLTNLFKIVKYHPQALIDELRFCFNSRLQFKEFLNSTPRTEIQAAAKFIYLLHHSFGGKGSTYGTGIDGEKAAKSCFNLLDRINLISKRLDKVYIENLSFDELIPKYDTENAFFYCDPPYTQGIGYITGNAKTFNHELLRDILKDIKGRFVLSYDDSEKVRELYKDFDIIPVTRQKGINGKNRVNKDYKELLIKKL